MNAKDIAEKIIRYADSYETDSPALASAYLELEKENDRLKNYEIAGYEEMHNEMKAEITKLKEKTRSLEHEIFQYEIDIECLKEYNSKYCGEVRVWQNRAEALSEENAKFNEENESIRTQLLAQCRMSHELADEKENLAHELETTTLEHESVYKMNKQYVENSKLKINQLREENLKLEEENKNLKACIDKLTPTVKPTYLNNLSASIHQTNVEAGWWTNLETGKPLERNVGELLCLVHSEVSEALEAYRKDLNDDKLPHRKGFEVELVDALIRIFDIAGKFKLDLDGALEDKLEYNAKRSDHKLEARRSQNGKKF